mgnify:CR=1 FL=1
MTRYMATIRLWLASLILPILGMPISTTATAENREEVQQVSGTLVKLDLIEGKSALNTDLGDRIPFDIPKPQLFERLSLGSRVTIRMDGDGGADRVANAFIADILALPSHEP